MRSCKCNAVRRGEVKSSVDSSIKKQGSQAPVSATEELIEGKAVVLGAVKQYGQELVCGRAQCKQGQEDALRGGNTERVSALLGLCGAQGRPESGPWGGLAMRFAFQCASEELKAENEVVVLEAV